MDQSIVLESANFLRSYPGVRSGAGRRRITSVMPSRMRASAIGRPTATTAADAMTASETWASARAWASRQSARGEGRDNARDSARDGLENRCAHGSTKSLEISWLRLASASTSRWPDAGPDAGPDEAGSDRVRSKPAPFLVLQAEGERFELSVEGLPLQRFSRPPRSTTPAPLQRRDNGSGWLAAASSGHAEPRLGRGVSAACGCSGRTCSRR